jgi:hypothetical protein
MSPSLVLLPAMLCDDDLYTPQIESLGDLVEARPLVVAAADMTEAVDRVLQQAPRDPEGADRLRRRVQAGEFSAVVEELGDRSVFAAGPNAATARETFRTMARRLGAETFLRAWLERIEAGA